MIEAIYFVHINIDIIRQMYFHFEKSNQDSVCQTVEANKHNSNISGDY